MRREMRASARAPWSFPAAPPVETGYRVQGFRVEGDRVWTDHDGSGFVERRKPGEDIKPRGRQKKEAQISDR